MPVLKHLATLAVILTLTACGGDDTRNSDNASVNDGSASAVDNNTNPDATASPDNDASSPDRITSPVITSPSPDPVEPSDPATGFKALARFSVKETAGQGAQHYPITTVFPLPYGKYQDTSQLQIIDAAGRPVAAQFEVLNRWWSKDNSIRHVTAHFTPKVSAFNGSDSQSGISGYQLVRNDQPAASVTNPVSINDSASKLTINNQLVQLTIEKSPLKIITPAGELESLFYDEQGNLDPSFNHENISIKVEERGPVRSVVRLSSPTMYIDPQTIKHGWAMRLYSYANSPLVRVEFQLQNSAINEKISAPLYFKGHHLRLTTNANTKATSLRAQTPPKGDILNLPMGILSSSKANVILRNFQQTFPNGLSQTNQGVIDIELWPKWSSKFKDNAYSSTGLHWLDDMQHVYKEVLLDFDAQRSQDELNALADTFQFPPVAAVPMSWYAETKSTFDLGGVVPDSSILNIDTSTVRKPSYEESQYTLNGTKAFNEYEFGIDNFGLDVYRKTAVAGTGGWPYSMRQFYHSGNPADYYAAMDFAKGELNIRPQWMANYKHATHFEKIQPSTNPYGGSSWRSFGGHGAPVITRDYLAGSSQSARPRDDQHAWFYHIEHAYYMSGNLWIKDWYEFMGEFKQAFLNNLDPYPDYSSRSVGHQVGVALSAYKATGNKSLIEAIDRFIDVHLTARMAPPHNVKWSSVDGQKREATFQIGYMLRTLIEFINEVGDDAETMKIMDDTVAWVYNYSRYSYYYPTASTTPAKTSDRIAISYVDPLLWYANYTNKPFYADEVNNYVEAKKVYGNFTDWYGQYEGRMYLYYKQLQQ